jgi:tetratricopeptide (TPR) repeat protein
MGGGGQKSTTNETKEVRLPAWVEAAGQENYDRAKQVANRPFQQYTGDRVANLDPAFNAAYKKLGTVDDYQGYYDQAGQMLQGLMDYNPASINPSSVQAGQIATTNLDPYMNPYTENVIDRTTANMERSGQLAQNSLAAQAAAGKSFGGSRQALQAGIQGAETTRGIGDYASGAREKAFTNAQQQAQFDITKKLEAETKTGEWAQQAQMEDVKNQLTNKGLSIQAADSLVKAAAAGQESAMNTIATYIGVGGVKQQQAQREIDQKMQKFSEKWNYPVEQLNILLSSLGMTPYGHTETGTSTTKTSGGGGGLGQAMGLGGSFLQMLPMLGASDVEMKTDIQVVGKHPTMPELKIYAYRYKGDPKSYPKTVGPMAHEVEKVAPHLVRKIGKRRVVDMRALTV